jgi:hypothetical protein
MLKSKEVYTAVRFEGFELDPHSGELRKDGTPTVRLPEQSFQILAMLLERAGKVVSRSEIQQHLWPDGTVVEFDAEDVAELARDLAAPTTFRLWVTDLASPALLRMLQKAIGGPLVEAGSPLKFAPREGPEFFAPYGWKAVETRSLLHTAAKLKRLSLGMRLLSLLPDPGGRKPNKPWGGVCLLENCGAIQSA